ICNSTHDALREIAGGELRSPIVIKADALAAGNGDVIAADRTDAEAVLRDVIVTRNVAAAGGRDVVAAHLAGQEAAYVVVTAGSGYPDSVETGKPISGLDAAAGVTDSVIFHAGTAQQNGHLVTSGGRVLTVVGRGATYRAAIDTAYTAAARINFEGMQFRHDIG